MADKNRAFRLFTRTGEPEAFVVFGYISRLLSEEIVISEGFSIQQVMFKPSRGGTISGYVRIEEAVVGD
jgi:hypothetical protein